MKVITENIIRKIIKETLSQVFNNFDYIENTNNEENLIKFAYNRDFKYIAYHNTDDVELTNFYFRNSGIHFGTLTAANERSGIRNFNDTYTKKFFLKIENPLVIEKDFDWEDEHLIWDDIDGDKWNPITDPLCPISWFYEHGFDVSHPKGGVKTVYELLSENGYDCIIYKNDIEDKGNYSIAMFKPEHIKLAETETYDDDGQVIPLENRFNTKINDIRY